MPEIQTTEVPVEAVKPGDVIATDNDCNWPLGARVASIDVKIKWVVIRDSNKHLIRRVEAGTLVKVDRSVPTAEEIAAERRAETVYLLNRSLERERSVSALLLKLADKSSLQYNDFDTLLMLNAEANMWARFKNVAQRVAEQGRGDVVTALAIFVNMLQERTDYRNPLSRSTSATANLTEDVQWYVEKDFVNNLRMNYGVSLAFLAAEYEAANTSN